MFIRDEITILRDKESTARRFRPTRQKPAAGTLGPGGRGHPRFEIARQLLPLCNLLARHHIFQYGHAFLSLCISLSSTENYPFVSLDIILHHAFALCVAESQIEVC